MHMHPCTLPNGQDWYIIPAATFWRDFLHELMHLKNNTTIWLLETAA